MKPNIKIEKEEIFNIEEGSLIVFNQDVHLVISSIGDYCSFITLKTGKYMSTILKSEVRLFKGTITLTQ